MSASSSSSEEVTFLAMGWIDESSPYHNSQFTYLEDKAEWEALMPLYIKWRASVEAPKGTLSGRGIEYLKYPTEDYLDDVYYANVGRPPGNGDVSQY